MWEGLVFTFWVAVVVGIGFGVFMVVSSVRSRNRARELEEEIRDLGDFDAADIYVSRENVAGIAIDRERRLLALTDDDDLRVLPITSIVSCEVLEDGDQLAYANRGSQLAGIAVGGALLGGVGAVIGGLSGSSRSVNNVTKLVLRFVTDDFDKPNHDILVFQDLGNKGIRRNSLVYSQALQTAELWHGRVTAMMRAEHRT